MQDLQAYWLDTLKRDLAGFADPRTDVLVDASGAEITAMWTQRGRDRNAAFSLSQDSDFRWLDGNEGIPRTYRDFLSSQGLADFPQLATATSQAFPAPDHYVATKATIDEGDQAGELEVSDSLMIDWSSDALQEPTGKTQLLFLKGDAGAGKTTLLQEITRRRAEVFQHGDSQFLFLYVSAQGRALSNLRDALSGELDDLRAGFTRDAVPALVRQGLLIPIIDGFDELLGAAGYGDAFGSLHQFLEQLAGLGVVIVSARSSFYDVEFLGREPTAGTQSAAYDIVPITLRPWDEQELFDYLARVRNSETVTDEDRRAVAELPESDRELLAKPFFASLFPEYVEAPNGKARGVSLADYLVDSYVLRESEKIVDRDNQPLLDADGHRQIFELTAESMWTDEKREFSADDLQTVAELVAGEVGLSGDSAKQLVTKITSYAGFRTSRRGREQRFQFEHEVYFDHFLSEALRRRITDGQDLGVFLDGGLLPEEVISAAVNGANASEWLNLLNEYRRDGVLHENRRRNSGTLAAAAFCAAQDVAGRTITYCNFINTSFGAAILDDVRFQNCRFSGVRLDQAVLRDCVAQDCMAESLIVTPAGELGIQGLVPGENIYSLTNIENGVQLYSPIEMRRLLRHTGMPGMAEEPAVTYSDTAEAIIQLLERVVQRYRQSNLLCLEDTRHSRIFNDENWRVLRDMLLEHEIVGKETRDASGSRKTFLRYKVALTDLMRLERVRELPPDNMGEFWRSLRQL